MVGLWNEEVGPNRMSDARKASIVYRVMGMDSGDWQEVSVLPQRATAMITARQTLKAKRFPEVRIDEYFLDNVNKRTITTTIFHRTASQQETIAVLPWVVSGILCCATGFVGVYAYVNLF